MTYTEWLLRPESERNAEAMRLMEYEIWADLNGREWWRKMEGDTLVDILPRDYSPCTDRNATDMLLAEVERRGRWWRFIEILGEEAVRAFSQTCICCHDVFVMLRTPASMLTWAACEACEEEA
jgi:hypothetical protein